MSLELTDAERERFKSYANYQFFEVGFHANVKGHRFEATFDLLSNQIAYALGWACAERRKLKLEALKKAYTTGAEVAVLN